MMDDAMPLEKRRDAAILWVAVSSKGWVQLDGLMIAQLGHELARTHQRLADVEKELRDLRAALK